MISCIHVMLFFYYLNNFAICGTNGSSGLGSAKSEHILINNLLIVNAGDQLFFLKCLNKYHL